MTHGAAAFNICGIAYQRSIMYQTADRTSVWRTMPMQLNTFRAYYPSLTLQPLLPRPTKKWFIQVSHNDAPHFNFFSFCPGQISPADRDSPHADGALLLLPPPAAEGRNKTSVNKINKSKAI